MKTSLAIRLNKVEQERFDKFQTTHKKCYNNATAGGKFNLNCTLTGIGIAFIARCNICDKEKDISDYDSW